MNVALIDHHPVFRCGIRHLLSNQFGNVTIMETGSMHSFGDRMLSEMMDLVIIGLSEEEPLIDRKGLRILMKKNPRASFIIYASGADRQSVPFLRRMGVKGYLSKNDLSEEFANCLQSVLAGVPYFCSPVRKGSVVQFYD